MNGGTRKTSNETEKAAIHFPEDRILFLLPKPVSG